MSGCCCSILFMMTVNESDGGAEYKPNRIVKEEKDHNYDSILLYIADFKAKY